MATRTTSKQDPYTVSITRGGLALIASDTPLTRLHYFDGKRLRAADLTHEQSALRSWLMLSNQAGGAGVVHGFDCHLTGDRLNLGRGLAIDPDGRLLLLPDAAAISIATLLDAARGDPDPTPPKAKSGRFTHCEPVRVQPPGVTVEHVELWLITLSHAETACGSEDVFGNPCESACVSSTDRPYLVEGVLLRAVPLALKTPLPTASAIAITRLHLRSQIAAAYFADDRRRVSSLISGPGLRAETWCLGSKLVGGTDVPIAVLARAAGETLFLDPWIPRRERIDPPPRQYWAARMAMRPWSGFLAEVLQFQCHLRDLLAEDPKRTPADPCAHTRATLRRTSDELRKLFNSYAAISERLIHGQPDDQPDLQDALARLERLQLDVAADNQRDALEPLDHILIHGGIVELPAAGYLPVQPGRDVELQVRRWLGDGLDLRFCIVRPDFVAHALEEAQHMDRISLLAGLDDPKAKPEVNILVPDGQLVPTTRHIGVEFTAKSRQDTRPNPTKGPAHAILLPQTHTAATAHGAGRTERLPGGGAALHLAGQLTPDPVHKLKPTTKPDTIPADEHSPDHNTPEVASLDPKMAAPGHTLAHTPPPTHLRGFLSATIDAHPADAAPGDRIPVHARLVVARSPGAPHLFDLDIDGTLHILTAGPRISAELTYAVNDAPAVIQPLELAWKPAPSGLLAAEITLERIGDPTITVELTLQWSPGAPHQVTATLVATSTAPMSPRQLVTEVHARFDHEPAVLEPTSPQHTTAIAVVDALAQAHDDKKFKPEALALLFPPRQPHAELIAPHDWVLFHRRRTKQCITPAPKPIPQRPPLRKPPAVRTYRIYAAVLDDLALGHGHTLKSLPGALTSGNFALDHLPEIGTARFPTDADTMLEQDIAPLKTAWHKIPAAFTLESAVVYSANAAHARTVAATLEPTPHLPTLPVVHLAHPPPHYSLHSIDGVIILVGRKRLAPTHSSVYWVDPADLLKLHHDGNLATFLKLHESPLLGTISFAAQTDTLVDTDATAIHIALSALPHFKSTRPLLAHAYCKDNHPDADPDLLEKRIKSLVAALKLTKHLTSISKHLKPLAELPRPNPMVILLSTPPGK